MKNKFLRGVAVVLVAIMFMTTGVTLKIYSAKEPENIVSDDQIEDILNNNDIKDENVDDAPVLDKLIFTQAPENYYDDALFIGDSRCFGLKKYAPKEGATYFVSVGLNVYKLDEQSIEVDNVGKTTLNNLLKNNKYGKIYIMLGINELGYDFNSTCAKYKQLISDIRVLQPDSIIIIHGNLRVSKAKSDSDKLYNNGNINKFNDAISKFANDTDTVYIDVNPIFDDGNGNLKAEYTGDEIHLYGNYYADWSAWLDTQAVIREAS